jgi:hypothetical protein
MCFIDTPFWNIRFFMLSTVQIPAKCLKWIPSVDYSLTQREVLAQRCEDSGSWLLQSDTFVQWMENTGNRLLWCPGDRESFHLSLHLNLET